MAEVDAKKKLSLKKKIAGGIVIAIVAAVCWALATFFGVEVSDDAQKKAVETGTALVEKAIDATDKSGAVEVKPATEVKAEVAKPTETKKAEVKADGAKKVEVKKEAVKESAKPVVKEEKK